MSFEKDYTIVYLSAGETPSESGLLFSQVIANAKYFYQSENYADVTYVCCVPYTALFASIIKRKKLLNLSWLKKLPFSVSYFYSFINLDYSFVFRNRSYFFHKAAKHISKLPIFKRNSKFVLICRSYASTHIGILLKDLLVDKSLVIIFDMRSLLPPEFIFMMGKKGIKYYGEAKEWERWLLKKSNISLLASERAIQLLKLENPDVNIEPIRISGISIEKSSHQIDFDRIWQHKKIAYIGSIGHWNSAENVEKTLFKLKECIRDSNVEIVSQNYQGTKIRSRTIKHNDMAEYYKTLLAIIIPGTNITNHFESLQLSVNLFSTKASEALSCGIPIIVNSSIFELSDFLKREGCGITFSIENGNVIFQDSIRDQLCNFDFWKTLQMNAMRISSEFTFEATAKKYSEYITRAISNSLIK